MRLLKIEEYFFEGHNTIRYLIANFKFTSVPFCSVCYKIMLIFLHYIVHCVSEF